MAVSLFVDLTVKSHQTPVFSFGTFENLNSYLIGTRDNSSRHVLSVLTLFSVLYFSLPSGMFYLFNNVRKIFLQLIVFTFIVVTVSGDPDPIPAENVTCEKSESSEFPEDLFTVGQRKCGALILHLIFFCYCFWAIALVCSERFLPAINCICEDLKLSDDIAAATFMSIATSTPELFSNIIGTFITESSIGIGHVIGNGYYNMFFVAALGGLAASQEILLDWWPLARDCSIYTLVALVLTFIVWDGVVTTLESVVLLILYFVYFFIMFGNRKIIRFLSEKLKRDISSKENEEESLENVAPVVNTKIQEKGDIEEEEALEPENFQLPPPLHHSTAEVKNERWEKARKIMAMPIVYSMRYTIPDVRIKTRRKYYPVSFVICVAWIGISTYFGTWMISVIGETVGVPDLVLGMTFMAAGGSIVEAYSVYYKAKRGECKIGLSNCLGCNTLDATICLGLPWFAKSLIPKSSECGKETSGVVLDSSLIHVNSLLLVLSTIALYFVFYLNKFKLDKRLGVVCGVLYALVIFVAISIENYAQNVSN